MGFQSSRDSCLGEWAAWTPEEKADYTRRAIKFSKDTKRAREEEAAQPTPAAANAFQAPWGIGDGNLDEVGTSLSADRLARVKQLHGSEALVDSWMERHVLIEAPDNEEPQVSKEVTYHRTCNWFGRCCKVYAAEALLALDELSGRFHQLTQKEAEKAESKKSPYIPLQKVFWLIEGVNDIGQPAHQYWLALVYARRSVTHDGPMEQVYIRHATVAGGHGLVQHEHLSSLVLKAQEVELVFPDGSPSFFFPLMLRTMQLCIDMLHRVRLGRWRLVPLDFEVLDLRTICV